MLARNLRGSIFLSKSLVNVINKGPRTKLALDYDQVTFFYYDHSSCVQSIKLFLPLASMSALNPQRYHMRDLTHCSAEVQISRVYSTSLNYPFGHAV